MKNAENAILDAKICEDFAVKKKDFAKIKKLKDVHPQADRARARGPRRGPRRAGELGRKAHAGDLGRAAGLPADPERARGLRRGREQKRSQRSHWRV